MKKYIVIDERKDSTGDIFDIAFNTAIQAIKEAM